MANVEAIYTLTYSYPELAGKFLTRNALRGGSQDPRGMLRSVMRWLSVAFGDEYDVHGIAIGKESDDWAIRYYGSATRVLVMRDGRIRVSSADAERDMGEMAKSLDLVVRDVVCRNVTARAARCAMAGKIQASKPGRVKGSPFPQWAFQVKRA